MSLPKEAEEMEEEPVFEFRIEHIGHDEGRIYGLTGTILKGDGIVSGDILPVRLKDGSSKNLIAHRSQQQEMPCMMP